MSDFSRFCVLSLFSCVYFTFQPIHCIFNFSACIFNFQHFFNLICVLQKHCSFTASSDSSFIILNTSFILKFILDFYFPLVLKDKHSFFFLMCIDSSCKLFFMGVLGPGNIPMNSIQLIFTFKSSICSGPGLCQLPSLGFLTYR